MRIQKKQLTKQQVCNWYSSNFSWVRHFVKLVACIWQWTSFAIKLILTVSFLFQANPSTAQGCPSVLLDWQIKSHLDARIGKKRASAFNGVGHQPATTLWSLRKPGSDAQDMVSATMLRFLMIKATATSSPPGAGNAAARCLTLRHGSEAMMGDGVEEAGRRPGMCSIGARPCQWQFTV